MNMTKCGMEAMISKCVEHMAGAEVVKVERASGAGGAEASRDPWKLENDVGGKQG